MAGISTSIQMADRMTPVLQSITTAMNMMVGSMTAAQTATDAGFNPAQATAMQQAVAGASAQLAQYQEELERVQNTPVTPPEPPQWNAAASQPVIMTSGTERFGSEYQAATAAAQQLLQKQKAISDQAMSMKVTPPGMINDVVATENRMQSLSNRVQQLNSIPVNLRTDQVNNQLEQLRGQLGQATSIQEELDSAMSRMDIGAANSAYIRLNASIDVAERNLRNNVMAQEQFNDKVRGGGSAYDGLAGKIGRIAGMLGIGLMVKKAAAMTYESAAQLEATEAKYRTVFSGMTDSADQFITQFQSLTPATVAEARSMASGMQDLLVPMGMQRSEATAMTGKMMNLVGALTNFNSATKSAEDVSGAFQSALSGQYDSLKSLGIQVNDTIVKQQAVSMGLASNTQNVSNSARAQALLALAYQQSGDALAAYNEESLDTTTRMQLLQAGFQDAFGKAGQVILPQINDLLAQVQTRMPEINSAIETFAGIFGGAIQIATEAFDVMMNVGGAVADNWSWIGPIVAGVAAALLAFKVATMLSAAAQAVYNAALLSCPLVWLAVAIGAVIAAIVVWVNRVGGLKVAWLTAVNLILTRADQLKIGFATIWNGIQNGIDNMQYGFESFKAGVLNTIGNLKVGGLMILQEFINGAIDRVNAFITAVNSIAGTSIQTIAQVEFGTNAAVEEKAKQEQRAANLAALSAQNAVYKQARQQQLDEQARAANRARLERQEGIAKAKAEADEKKSAKNAAEEENGSDGGANNEVAANTGATAANTAAMADSMDIMDEDLKYMRDAAEQEIINRFTLAELKVDVKNSNTLTKRADFDDMGSFLSTFTGEFLASAAEGGHL